MPGRVPRWPSRSPFPIVDDGDEIRGVVVSDATFGVCDDVAIEGVPDRIREDVVAGHLARIGQGLLDLTPHLRRDLVIGRLGGHRVHYVPLFIDDRLSPVSDIDGQNRRIGVRAVIGLIVPETSLID